MNYWTPSTGIINPRDTWSRTRTSPHSFVWRKPPSGQSGKSGQQVHERTRPRFASLLSRRVAPGGLAFLAQGLCGVTGNF